MCTEVVLQLTHITKDNGLQHRCCNPLNLMAEWTGLEPATPGVTGRYSNQLNYHSSYSNLLLVQRAAVVLRPPDVASPRGFEPL